MTNWFKFGKKAQPKQDNTPHHGAAKIDPMAVKPAPVDPVLEAAARETSARIRGHAKQIDKLSIEILEMTDGLLSHFKSHPDEKNL